MMLMTSMLSLLGLLLIACGALLLLVAAWGVLTLPDALSRQHASTKAGTLALALVVLGTMALVAQAAWTWRLALVLCALLVTLPVSSQLLARAAVRAAVREQHGEAPLAVDEAPPEGP